MSWVDPAAANVFKVDVAATSSGGHPPEFWARRCVERLIQISDSAPEPILEQAKAFQQSMEGVILLHMKRAIQSDRTTVSHAVSEAGQPQLAETIRRL
jgi:hypothetical protein